MIAYLIGLKSCTVCDVWQGTLDELRERFNIEGHGYILRVYDGDPSLDGSEVVELQHE